MACQTATGKLQQVLSLSLTLRTILLTFFTNFSTANSGFSVYPGYSGCSDDGMYKRSFGHLTYVPSGADDNAKAAELALLLTAGRLSAANLDTIVNACANEPDGAKTRCMQQLLVTTGEFHSTNTVTLSGEDRATETTAGNSTESYKVS